MKRFLLLLSLALIINTASAEFYFGVPSSTAIIGSETVPFVGLQAGSHEVAPNFGVRGYFESDATLSGIWLQGGADVLFTTGEYSTFYIGGGAGVARISLGDLSGTAFYLNPVIGADFDSSTTISWFVEASPRVYVASGTEVLFYIRSGLNFHFGSGSERVAASPAPAVATPVAAQSAPTGEPTFKYKDGRYVDRDGNVWLEPYDSQTATLP